MFILMYCLQCSKRRRVRSMICLSTSRHFQFSIVELLPLYAPHILIVLSRLPLTRVCPSGLMATLQTMPVWPVRVRTSLPVDKSHTLIVLSELPLTRVCPSGLMATLQTASAWPVRVRSNVSCSTGSGSKTGALFFGCCMVGVMRLGFADAWSISYETTGKGVG